MNLDLDLNHTQTPPDDVDAPLQCKRCGSHKLHTGMGGYSLLTGMIDLTRVVTTCLKCGNRFVPPRVAFLSRVDWIIVVTIAGVVAVIVGGPLFELFF